MVCGTFLVPFDAERTRITEWQGNLPSTEPFPNANEVPPTIKTFVYFPEKSACDSTGAHSVTPRRAEKIKCIFSCLQLDASKFAIGFNTFASAINALGSSILPSSWSPLQASH